MKPTLLLAFLALGGTLGAQTADIGESHFEVSGEGHILLDCLVDRINPAKPWHFTVRNCKMAEGATLDEVMNGIVGSAASMADYHEEEMQMVRDSLKKIDKDLKVTRKPKP